LITDVVAGCKPALLFAVGVVGALALFLAVSAGVNASAAATSGVWHPKV
jgi:hypothetical protein